jgi:LacI family transcriptional regulator
VVLIGRPPEALSDASYVAVDNVAAAREAALHLMRIGRKRVVHVSGPLKRSTTMADRARGFIQGVANQRLPSEVIQTDGSPEAGVQAASQLFDRAASLRPDAIFAATDRLALAVMSAAYDSGLRVPQDVAVVGFDDTPLAAYVRPSLSSVAQPARELGEAAIRLACQALAGGATESVILPARLVVRQSSQA